MSIDDIPLFITYPIQSEYVGENVMCTSECRALCPPYVTYYTDTRSQESAQLRVEKGFLKTSDGKKFDTTNADEGTAIFVVDSRGRAYASYQHKPCLFEHSSLVGGADVAFAGTVVAKQGEITGDVSTGCSHYKMPEKSLSSYREALSRQGYYEHFAADDGEYDGSHDIIKDVDLQ